MSDRVRLVESTRALLACVSPWINEVSVVDWDGTAGYSPILRRSVLRRQFDALEVSVELVESEHGYAAVTLLRPACEELLWLRYLAKLTADDAKMLAEWMIISGLLSDLNAQASEVGEEEMTAIGLHPALKMSRSKASVVQQKLREIGKRLGWSNRVVSKGSVPSTWFIAKTTDSTDLYRFLYHATSRYVHFSPVELARRGWGQPGRLELSSQTYEPVWAMFSLSWGARLLGWSIAATSDALETEGVPEPDHTALQEALNRITDVPLIPLVTPQELVWDSNA